jgi:hypothetical protein
MIPDLTATLGGIARGLMTDVSPEIRSPYGTLTVQLAAALLHMIAQEADRAAARLVDENDAMLILFRDAAATVTDQPLRAALATAVAEPAPSLHVADLRLRNRTLRALLTRLHAHVETLTIEDARALDARIWAELVTSTRRRALDMAIG